MTRLASRTRTCQNVPCSFIPTGRARQWIEKETPSLILKGRRHGPMPYPPESWAGSGRQSSLSALLTALIREAADDSNASW